MSVTLIDGVRSVSYFNGVLRIDCVSAGPNNEERPSGTCSSRAARRDRF